MVTQSNYRAYNLECFWHFCVDQAGKYATFQDLMNGGFNAQTESPKIVFIVLGKRKEYDTKRSVYENGFLIR